jgi:hypothetical protein
LVFPGRSRRIYHTGLVLAFSRPFFLFSHPFWGAIVQYFRSYIAPFEVFLPSCCIRTTPFDCFLSCPRGIYREDLVHRFTIHP